MMILVEHRSAIYPKRAPDPCNRRLKPIAPQQKIDAVCLAHYMHGLILTARAAVAIDAAAPVRAYLTLAR
jgi:hypothetical protein